jgi:hypothetical protein
VVLLSVRAMLLRPKIWYESIAGEQTFGMAVHVTAHPAKKGYYIVTAKEGKVLSI